MARKHALVAIGHRKRSRCHLDERQRTTGAKNLSEAEKADTQAFLREILQILPLVGLRVFECHSCCGCAYEKDSGDLCRRLVST